MSIISCTSPWPSSRILPAIDTRRPSAADRKSTRLNSSHSQISYAVFCLKKKKTQRQFEAGRPDERRSALGEMQLEARQMADAERQIASELCKAGARETAKDTVQRLATVT